MGDKYDVQVNIHTDTLNESGFVESESLSWASGGNIKFPQARSRRLVAERSIPIIQKAPVSKPLVQKTHYSGPP